MPVNEEELHQFLMQDESELFWEFWFLFTNLIRQQHQDLPQLKSHSITVDFTKLAPIFYYCSEHNQEPSPTLLMETLDDYCDTPTKDLLDCFKTAMQKVQIPKHTEKLVGKSADRLREHGKSTTDPTTEIRGKRRANGSKRAMPENVAFRKGLVKGFEKANPRLKGKTLTLETCKCLDSLRVEVPEGWKKKYKIETWEAGYRHDQVKGLIESMFSTDRNTPF